MAPLMGDRFTLDIEIDAECTQSFPGLPGPGSILSHFPYSSLYSHSRADVHFINMCINSLLAVEVIY